MALEEIKKIEKMLEKVEKQLKLTPIEDYKNDPSLVSDTLKALLNWAKLQKQNLSLGEYYQIAKNKLVADKRKDKNYTKELKSEIKDVKKNVKSDAILVDISYADHVCRTAELAEKYGKDFVNTFASNIADKIVVTSKKVDDGTYKPVYKTKNGNEITPENLRIAIINDGKDI